MSNTIDYWVCTEVYKDLQYLESHLDILPTISVNIHPHTIANKELIIKIIKLFKGYKINFEIIERVYLVNPEKSNKSLF